MTADKIFLYRYPGTKPFEANEYKLFKGRDEDIKNLYELISLQSLIVLYGRSGLGKSSLLNAGLINSFNNDKGLVPMFLRFGAYYNKNTPTPLEKLHELISVEQKTNSSNFIFEKLISKEEITLHHLWYFFKSFQIANPDKQKFILIFDQFEELFTYPENEIDLFKKELSELLYVNVPQQLRNLLKDKLLMDSNYLTKEEKDLLFRPLNIKILFSIRSDKLSLLNNLKDYFPFVLKLCYELKPLNKRQARQAIEEPAKLDDEKYISAPFTFTEEAIALLLNSLTAAKSDKEDKSTDLKQEIETFQLQIVCKHAENLSIEKNLRQITASDLGNIKDIFENHYRNIIDKLSPDKQLPARRLIEEKLIIDGTRVSMPIPFILRDPGMTTELLDELINTHILRREQNNAVEISHDTLIEPILKYYDERKKQEAIAFELREKEEQIKRIKAQQEFEAQELKTKRNKLFISTVTIALMLTLVLAGYALYKSRIANDQKKLAETQREIAINEKERADINAKQAILARRAADSNASIATKQASLAKQALQEAEFQKKEAEKSAGIVRELLMAAEEQKEMVTARVEALLLYALAREKVSEDPTVALRIEEAAIKKYPDPMILEDAQEIFEQHTLYKILNNIRKDNFVLTLATLSPDGTKILTGGGGDNVTLWNIDGSFIRDFKPYRGGVRAAAFSPDGKKILIGSGRPRLWNIDGSSFREFEGHRGSIMSAAFSPDGTKILTGGSDKIAILWDTVGTLTKKYELGRDDIISVAFSKDGKKIVTGTRDGTWLWNIDSLNSSEKRELEVRVNSVAFSRTGESILIGFNKEKTGIFDLEGNLIMDFMDPTGDITSIAFSPDRSRILTGSKDGSVKMWAPTGYLIKEFRGHEEDILAIAFSSDGKAFFTWSADKTVRFWKIDKPNDMTLEEYLKSDMIEPLTEAQKKEFGIK